MALPLEMIRFVLRQKDSFVRFDQGTFDWAAGLKGAKADLVNKIQYNQFPCATRVEFKGLTFRAVNEGDPNCNAVNVAYEADWATIGLVDAPGYVFTGSMSGCSFYLYRGFGDSVAGVHASKQSGVLIDPSQYFTARGSHLLYRWDSQGKLIGTRQGLFGAVLCCVDLATIHIYAMALRGSTVEHIFETKKVDNWRSADNPIVTDI